MKYGTREWLELQYAKSRDDPWGLDWRPSQRFRYERMLAAIQREAGAPWSPKRMIDVGCATGTFTARLSNLRPKETVSVIGLDIAQSAVDRARARYPAIEFHRMSLAECALQYAASADLVTCLEVIYYLPESERSAAVRMLRSLLRPGGILMVSSMLAGKPYMSMTELGRLVGTELPLVNSQVLYLKPLAVMEKIWMRLMGVGFRRSGRTVPVLMSPNRIEAIARFAAISERLLHERAQSHGYVLARVP
jgi:2-polyprenyl-3-methyl-5-hydroxy-6-metoxy-1,4-benzoquinol methylase